MNAVAYWLEDEKLAAGTPKTALEFLLERGRVISLVGGGGKTTLMYALAQAACERGLRAAVTTTTHIGLPTRLCRTMDDCRACWAAGTYAVCGEETDGKLSAPAPALMEALLAEAQVLLVEADGARRLPCKAPAAHEPVILPQTDVVIAVMGLDALDKPVQEICLRADVVQALLGCAPAHRITGEDMVKLLCDERGSRKGVGGREYVVVLNKCDDAQRLEAGRQMLTMLRERGLMHAVLTAGMVRSETFERAARR